MFSPVQATHMELVREYYKQREDLKQALDAGKALTEVATKLQEEVNELRSKET